MVVAHFINLLTIGLNHLNQKKDPLIQLRLIVLDEESANNLLFNIKELDAYIEKLEALIEAMENNN